MSEVPVPPTYHVYECIYCVSVNTAVHQVDIYLPDDGTGCVEWTFCWW